MALAPEPLAGARARRACSGSRPPRSPGSPSRSRSHRGSTSGPNAHAQRSLGYGARDGARRAPARRCARPSCRSRSRGPARCCSRWRPAASAARTCTSSTASSTEPEAAARARAPDRGARGRRRRALPAGERVGVPWLGWTCGDCRYCRSRAREPLRPRPLHRLRPRRRLRRAGRGRRALLLPAARRLPRPAGRAAAVRGADRLPHAAAGRRRRAARHLRLRRGGAHHLPGGAPRGPARVRVHAPGRRRRRRRSRASSARSGRATRSARRPRSSTRRSSSPRPARSCRPRCAALAKGGVVVCGGIHMSDIPAFPTSCSGASACCARWRT